MDSTPFGPRLLKGALVGIEPFNPLASVIVFQYNPETLTRTLQVQAAGGEDTDRSEVLRLRGAPIETIKMDVEIDATDMPLAPGPAGSDWAGIYPQLSALEMLLYPKSALVVANTILLAVGTIEIIPPTGVFTVLVWGPKRVLPVRLTEFSVTEDVHDNNLNPIRAKVSLGLRVLSYNDLPLDHLGYHMFLAHQVLKETMATIGSTNNLAALGGVTLA